MILPCLFFLIEKGLAPADRQVGVKVGSEKLSIGSRPNPSLEGGGRKCIFAGPEERVDELECTE